MASESGKDIPIQPQLGMWDAVSIIIGIVIGSTIYKSPPLIFQNVAGPWEGLGIWLLCGALALVGAFCYAELATTYPRSGGDYVYLSRAYGKWVGYLFGWAQLAVILTASTGAMAFVFAEYALEFVDASEGAKAGMEVWLAVLAVVALAAMNFFGVILGKTVQNALTILKVLGLGGIIVAGFLWAEPAGWEVSNPIGGGGYGLAFILVLYGFGGWNDAAFVAADVRDRRNIARALIIGVFLITLIYLAVNAAYISGLGFEGVRKADSVAARVLEKPLGDFGGKAMSVLVMVSALGAINGLVFTGSRVYTALGAEHRVFALLGRWHPRLNSPVWSLLVHGAITLAMILVVGTSLGRNTINNCLGIAHIPAIPWDNYGGGFLTLFAGSAPVFWTFFLLTGISLFILRWKDRGIERPFCLRIPFFPILPLVFCAMCGYGLYAATTYAKWVSLIGIVPLVIGMPLYFVPSSAGSADNQESPDSPSPEA